MRGSEFAELKAFVAIGERQSFARAAERLGLSPSALSQTIRQLEARLGVRVLNRTTRSVAPSANGERLYRRVAPLFQEMAVAVAEASEATSSAEPWASTHRASPPESYRAGAGALPSNPPGCAARYRGAPKTPAELQDHACINWRLQMDGRPYRWEFQERGQPLEVAVGGPVVTNHPDIGIAAALQGLDIAYYLEREGVGELLVHGRLTQVLADWSISRPGLFLYYPNRQYRPAALSAFIDCLLDRDQPCVEPRPR